VNNDISPNLIVETLDLIMMILCSTQHLFLLLFVKVHIEQYSISSTMNGTNVLFLLITVYHGVMVKN
jgi:hypothetical protein